MKKMLVSDYDGTLDPDTNKNKLRVNVRAIKRFIRQGNLFVIATGRTSKSILNACKKYLVPYHYIISYDGAVILDKDGNKIFSNPFTEYELNYILYTLKNNNIVKNIYLYNSNTHTKEEKDIVEIEVNIPLFAKTTQLEKEIHKIIPEARILFGTGKMFITRGKNKKNGIEELLAREKIKNIKVYSIGDSINDLEMLETPWLHGHKVVFSHPSLYFKGIKTCTSVKSLTKKLLKE